MYLLTHHQVMHHPVPCHRPMHRPSFHRHSPLLVPASITWLCDHYQVCSPYGASLHSLRHTLYLQIIHPSTWVSDSSPCHWTSLLLLFLTSPFSSLFFLFLPLSSYPPSPLHCNFTLDPYFSCQASDKFNSLQLFWIQRASAFHGGH